MLFLCHTRPLFCLCLILAHCQGAAATCSDTTKNQDETGIDCGGGECPPCHAGAAAQLVETNVPYSGHLYSSIFKNHVIGVCHGRGQLDSIQGWAPAQNALGEWMQLNLGTVKSVGGIVVQSRGRGANDGCASVIDWSFQRVLTYRVSVSTDGNNFEDVDNTRNFTGNTVDNPGERAVGYFSRLYMVQFVRIYPLTWVDFMGMRAGLLIYPGPSCSELQFLPGETEIGPSLVCTRSPFNSSLCQETRTHQQLDSEFDFRKGPNRGAVSGGLGKFMTDKTGFIHGCV